MGVDANRIEMVKSICACGGWEGAEQMCENMLAQHEAHQHSNGTSSWDGNAKNHDRLNAVAFSTEAIRMSSTSDSIHTPPQG